MRYLGELHGVGTLICAGKKIARAKYDFDGFLTKPALVTSNGEIQMSPEALRGVFGRTDLQLRTDDGRVLDLRFSEKRLRHDSDSAHVDVAGALPLASEWRH